MVKRFLKRVAIWREKRVQHKHLARLRLVMMGCACAGLALIIWIAGPLPSTSLSLSRPSGLFPGQPNFPETGKGAGGSGVSVTQAQTVTTNALCNPLDAACTANSMASWAAEQIQHAVQPLADALLENPANIVYQTPLGNSDAENSIRGPILTMNTFFIGAVDLALAFLILVGGYNVVLGHHLHMPYASLGELLARAILVVCAVHFNVFFLSLFIDFENIVALAVIHISGLAMLTNLIAGIFTNPITGLVAFVLFVALAVLVIWLFVQQIVRLAMVGVCFALAPLGLGCLMLPQTLRWGRLWLTMFTSSVLVQLLQVVTLGLGGIFITAIASTSLARLDKGLATALLAIGVLSLVLKIPGMLNNWALHPMLEGFGGGGKSVEQEQATTSAGTQGSGSASEGSAAAGSAGTTNTMTGTMVTEESGSLLLLF